MEEKESKQEFKDTEEVVEEVDSVWKKLRGAYKGRG